jgi:GT2 family glycosyltransferase
VNNSDSQIAAVVVTYNRKELLGECLNALLAQSHPPDSLYIVDNQSSDGTYAFLADRGFVVPSEKPGDEAGQAVPSVKFPTTSGRSVMIRYLRLEENSGSAGGFHAGLKQAAADGYKWFWIMDDDTLPTPSALAVLVDKKDDLERSQAKPFILNSLVVASDGQDDETLAFPLQELSRRGFPKPRVYYWHLSEIRGQIQNGLYRWACPFNGMFLPAQVIGDVGLPNPDLFIWGDESDFLWRIAKRFDVYTAVDSRVLHPQFHPAGFNWKRYYQIRNGFVVNRHFNFTMLRNLKLTLTSLALGLRHGRSALRLVLRAIKDGVTGNLGRKQGLP